MDAKTFEKYKTTPFYALELDKQRKYKHFMQHVQQEYDWLTEVLKEIPAMLPQDEFMVLPAKTPGKRNVRAAVAQPLKLNFDDNGDPPSSPAASQPGPPLSIEDLEPEPKIIKKNTRVLRSLRSRAAKNRVSISKKKAKKLSSHSRTCTYSPRHIKASPSASSTPDRRDGDKRKQRTLRLKRTAAVKRLYLTPDKRKMFEESLNSLKADEQSPEEVLAGMTSAMNSSTPKVLLHRLVTEGGPNEEAGNPKETEKTDKDGDLKEKKAKESETVIEDVGLTTIDNYVTAIESPAKEAITTIIKECQIVLKPLSPTLVKQLQLSASDSDEDEVSAASSPHSETEGQSRNLKSVSQAVVLTQPSRRSRSSKPVDETVVLPQNSRPSRSSRPVNETLVLSQPTTSPPVDVGDDVDVIADSPKSLSKSDQLFSSTPEKRERRSSRLSRKRSSHNANLNVVVALKKIALESGNEMIGRESAFVEANEAEDVIAPLAAPVVMPQPNAEPEPDSFFTDDEWDTIDDESVSIINNTKTSVCTPQNSRSKNWRMRMAHSADGSHRMKKMKRWKTHRNSSLDKYKKGSNLSRISNTSTPGRLQKTPKERLSEMEDERRRELRERMRKEMQRMKEREERVAKEREARRIANEMRRQMVLSKKNEMELKREKKEEEQRKKAQMALARRQQEEKEREESERRVRRQREEMEKKAKEEVERRQREAERKAKEEAERRQRETERKAKEIERRQKEAEQKMKEEMERRARMEAERKAKEDAERRTKLEAERRARIEAERKAKEDAERRVKLEAERRARVEAERKAREEAYKRAREEERKMASLKHQQQMTVLKASSRVNVPDFAPSKPKKIPTCERYDISDLHSDQETDDDEQPRKKVPVWATRNAMLSLCRHVRKQETNWWLVFQPSDTMGVDLSQMFSESTRQFRSRTSSAVWDIPPALKNNRPYL